MAEEEKTREEKARDMAKSVLEDTLTRNTLGANIAHKKYGDKGNNAYSAFMNGEDVTKEKINSYNSQKESYKNLGVVGEPSMPTDGDFSAEKISQINEMKRLLSVGDLESIVNSAGGTKFKVRDELKDYTITQLIKKAYDEKKGEIDEEKFDENEKEAFLRYRLLTSAYDEIAAFKIVEDNYLAGINSAWKELDKKYEDSKKKSE